MGQPGWPKRELVLSSEERETLERWARRHTNSQALAMRCPIVLACAEGGTNVQIAGRLGLYDETEGKWRNGFIQPRLAGLGDKPRPGKPRTITDEDVERVIVKTLQETLVHATQWSTRQTAAAGPSLGPHGPDPAHAARNPRPPDP